MTQKRPPASLLLVARRVAANQKNAPANPPAPANVGASAPLHPVDDVTDGKLVDGAHSRRRMDFRFSGRRGTLAFGVHPAVGLANARE